MRDSSAAEGQAVTRGAPGTEHISFVLARVLRSTLLRVGADELAARALELREAESELAVAHDRATWARWRLMLSTARLERAMRLSDRVHHART